MESLLAGFLRRSYTMHAAAERAILSASDPLCIRRHCTIALAPETAMVFLQILQGESAALQTRGRMFRRVLCLGKRLSFSETHGGAHDSFLVRGGFFSVQKVIYKWQQKLKKCNRVVRKDGWVGSRLMYQFDLSGRPTM